MDGSIHERETEYDGTGTGHAPYGEPAYRGRGQAGDEVAEELEQDLVRGFGSDDLAREHLPPRMSRLRADAVPRLAEEEYGADLYAECATEEVDSDRHELSAEEAAMHYVDEDSELPE